MSVKVNYLYVTAAGDIYRDASNSLAVTSLNSHTTNLVGPNWLAIVEGFHIDHTRNIFRSFYRILLSFLYLNTYIIIIVISYY